MRRVVSVWLPRWPIERMRRASPRAVPVDEPLALISSGARGLRITAVNEAAAKEGVRAGVALADARAALPALAARHAEPRLDREALSKLAAWCGRYGPLRNISLAEDAAGSPPDGLWIDATGVAHLYGGEAALMADLCRRLAGFGLTVRTAMAETHGAAHALARLATDERMPFVVAPPGEARALIAPLSVAGLRLERATLVTLRRLGLDRIGQLYDMPRAALARRFRRPDAGAEVLGRLDMALGCTDEPLPPLADPPLFAERRPFPEPLVSADVLPAEIDRLAARLSATLAARAQGALRIRLGIYRADGSSTAVVVGLTAPSRDARHISRLIEERLGGVDAGFGIDLLILEALATAPLADAQAALGRGGAVSAAILVDRLSNRLGRDRVVRPEPADSHLPERAAVMRPVTAYPAPVPWPKPRGLDPPTLLFDPPEPVRVMAEVPEGPPRQFVWRRRAHAVVRAEGPQRIAPEWWRWLAHVRARSAAEDAHDEVLPSRALRRNRPRDYYRLEDGSGAAFLVFREGLYQTAEESGAPEWFMHGLYG